MAITIYLPAQGRPYRGVSGNWVDQVAKPAAKGRSVGVLGDRNERCLAVRVSSADPAEIPTLIVGGNVMYTQDAVELAYRVIEKRDKDLTDEKQRYREEQDRWRQYAYDALTAKREYQQRNWRTAGAPQNVR